ncbi:hypothetical protein FQA39_LY18788 [Lamprigera yunnana]|nr:hypothetical protein FQA39_LY18788 [Lamprigera yunnana]
MWPFLIISLAAFLFYVFETWKPKEYPPGPRWLPIVGNYTFFRRRLEKLRYHHLVWDELAKMYGPVVGLKMGKDFVVTVFGMEAVREVLTRDEFDGRPDGFFFRLRTFGKRLGIVFSDGELWQKQRKFSLHHLKNFGLGKREMELNVAEESKELIADFDEKSGQSDFHAQRIRCERDERSLDDDGRLLDISGGLLNQMPLVRFIAPNACGYTKVVSVLSRLWHFLEETIAEHRKTVCSSHSRDLIDAFLQKMNISTADDSFTDEQLLSLCLDLFMAGSETTSNTLSFAMLYMVKYADVQRRVQKEIDNVVGRNRWPTMQDKMNLPYTEAVLMEVMRIANVPPLGIAHRAICEATLFGYKVPKGSIVLTSLYSIHMDKNFWKDPDQFRPERFLTEERQLIIPDWNFLPFGRGKRRCLGESLAKTNYFHFFTAMLHNFVLERDPDVDDVNTEGLTVLLYHLNLFRLSLWLEGLSVFLSDVARRV